MREKILRRRNTVLWLLACVLAVHPGPVAAATEEKLGETMVLVGGKILSTPVADAVAVRDGKTLALGSREEVLARAGAKAEVIELGGRTVLPGFTDHHLHLLNIGFALLNQKRNQTLFLNLSAARSLEEVARLVAARAAEQPPGSWVLGTGWSQSNWGTQALPTHEVLSKAAPEHPVFLVRVDAHSAWVNAKALAAAGITRETPDPYGGLIRRFEDGSPSGVLLERATEPLLEKISAPSDADLREAFRLGARALAERGFTEVFDAGFLSFPSIVAMNGPFERIYELLRTLDAAEPLPLRVNLMVPAPSALAAKVLARPQDYVASPRLRVTHIKLFADGAFGSRGAAVREPYADDAQASGLFRMSQEEIESYTRRALGAGLDVATHAIGDAAVGRVLDAYEAVLGEQQKLNPRRLRIEHFSYGTARDRERAAKLGVLIVGQPGFVYPFEDGKAMEDWRLGPERVRGAYAWASLLKAGAALAGSSDDYGLPEDPFWRVFVSAQRQNPDGIPPAGWQPQERIGRAEALGMLTGYFGPGGAESAGIVVGGRADLVVVSGDPLEVSAGELLKLRVQAVWLEGRLTFSRGSISGLD
ncbi:MAG: amidohydrolase [Candidatus Acidiferrales bacterium]